MKTVTKNKNLGKKKLKQDSDSALCDPTFSDVNNQSVPGIAPLVCERCLCAVENTSKENNRDMDSISPGDGVNLSNVPLGLASIGCNSGREIIEVKRTLG